MTVVTHPLRDRQPVADQPARFRYGIVFVLTLALVVFVIAAPSANWSRAVALAIESAALVVAVATAREHTRTRRRDALVVGIALLALVAAVATGAAPTTLTDVVNLLVTAAIPLVIVRGVLQLLRERGATAQAVAGALTIYLAIGLWFAWIVDFLVHAEAAPYYFAQQTNGTAGDRVYFSFTVLTTTGFGDYSAANPAGHALAVIEMLAGQLYLVTVIGLLIGNYVTRRPVTTDSSNGGDVGV